MMARLPEEDFARVASGRRADPASTRPHQYRLELADPGAHLIEVMLTIAHPDPDGQRLSLPAWIPGSYMIREFARQITTIEANCGRRRVPLHKLDKHTWIAQPVRAALRVRYRVYAWDLSVRGAHFDASHAFLNGTSVFLRVIGQEDVPCEVDIARPADQVMRGWRVATTLPRIDGGQHEFGRFRAADYDELIDHPVEIGDFTLASFRAAGTRHEIAITGRHDADTARLCRDLAPVCESQARLFEPGTGEPPFERFLFQVTAVGDGYGGLEHRSSTALLCARSDLPYPGMKGMPDGYRRFLGLASHEYFHAWHVKRIRPAVFTRYDLDRENYTRLLWIFEGFTSYYDDLMLARARVIGIDDYLRALGDTISGVLRTPGRHLQSVAESSFDAWTRYYRQDEHSPNATVSYYAKGALVALALDLTIRRRTAGKRSLDDVMRLLWRRHGRDRSSAGLAEDGFDTVVREATGQDLSSEIRRWSDEHDDPPLAELLGAFGVNMTLRAVDPTPTLGIRTAMRGADLSIGTVYTNGPAHYAGLSAGDVLVALDGLRVDEKGLKTLLARRRAGDAVEIHVFRRDELLVRRARLSAPPATDALLVLKDRPTARALQSGRRWLGITGKWPASTKKAT